MKPTESELAGKSGSQHGQHIKIEEPDANLVSQSDSNDLAASDEDKQNLVLCGCSDKKIYQFDTETGDIVQEYNEHLGAVNSITFVDENRRFVTSSDDKSLRVWDFGIPVQIKYIADPTMHSMPSVAAHPNGNFII